MVSMSLCRSWVWSPVPVIATTLVGGPVGLGPNPIGRLTPGLEGQPSTMGFKSQSVPDIHWGQRSVQWSLSLPVRQLSLCYNYMFDLIYNEPYLMSNDVKP